MKKFSCAALPLVMCVLSPMAQALGLGEVRALTPLGVPLRAEVLLITQPEDKYDAACFRLVKPRHDDGPVWLRRASLTVVQGAIEQKIVLTTRESIREPILPFALHVGCGVEVTREYTLLLSPVEFSAATVEALPPKAVPVVAASVARPAEGSPGTWSPGGGQSLQDLARTLYPHSRRMQRAFVKEVLASNPVLDGNPDEPIPQGLTLVFPDMRARVRQSPAMMPKTDPGVEAPSVPRPLLSGADRKVARPSMQLEDRLVLGGNHSAEVDAVLRLKLSAELLRLDGAPETTEQRRSLLRMEYRLITQMTEQTSSQLEVATRVRELEATMAELRALAQNLAGPIPVDAPVPPAAAPAPVVVPLPPPVVDQPVPVRVSTEPVDVASGWLEWTFFGGLALAIAGAVGYAAYRGRRRPQEDYGWYGGHRIGTEDGAAASSVFRPPTPTLDDLAVADEPFADTAALDDAPVPKPLPTRNDAVRVEFASDEEDNVTEVFEEHSVVELADIMLAFGRTKGAAEMLHEHIVSNPKEALAPWFKLLEIYRQSGLRDEFESVAMRLHKTFNVKVEDWDASGNEDARGQTLEAYPHIAAKLSQKWRQPDCADYLRKLLEDNRDGQRVGFPRPVAEEINVLLDILSLDAGAEFLQ